jgi:hypothetical protein
MAAVLACGPGALLSHRSAAALWGFRPSAATQIDVSAIGRSRLGQPGILVHLPRHLEDEDSSVREGIPVTSVARTLLDLGQVLRMRDLRRALDEAERLRLFDLRAVERLIARSHGHRGLGMLNTLLADYRGPPPITRSGLERRFLELCYEAGLPPPQTNILVEGYEVDAAWLEHRLIVELDSHGYHGTRAAFENDRVRDAILQAAGYRVIRITDRRMADAPAEVVRLLRALLSPSRERPGGAPRAGVRGRRAGPVS